MLDTRIVEIDEFNFLMGLKTKMEFSLKSACHITHVINLCFLYLFSKSNLDPLCDSLLRPQTDSVKLNLKLFLQLFFPRKYLPSLDTSHSHSVSLALSFPSHIPSHVVFRPHLCQSLTIFTHSRA